ncbi:hypothetical protein HGRIS_014812 [Hohenbuehelia grisea]|uniref:DUF5648 domain-containing protein n=1 Tax=Hohenbuehelia grisea TaxID=104357 RepID=A0ABR3IQV6_9AGAR
MQFVAAVPVEEANAVANEAHEAKFIQAYPDDDRGRGRDRDDDHDHDHGRGRDRWPPRPNPQPQPQCPRPPPKPNCPLDPIPAPQPVPPCLLIKTRLQPVWRIYHGPRNNHYYSVFPNQVQHLLGQGFKRETLDFMVFATQEPGTVPLFRVYNDARGDHTYFLDQAGVAQTYAWGYRNDGIVGYVQCGGAEPLRKVYKDTLVVPKIYPGGRAYHNVISNYDHLLITHEPSYFPSSFHAVRQLGFKYESVVGFGFPAGTKEAAQREVNAHVQNQQRIVSEARTRALQKQVACLQAFVNAATA